MKKIRHGLWVMALLMGSTAPVAALEDGKITIWLSADKGFDQLRAIADTFTEELGVEVVLESPEPITEQFQKAAATGDGPDIVLWPHDRLGEWSTAGLITDVSPSAGVKDAMMDVGWEAVSFDGKVWGYPIAVEAIGLIYNADIITDAPATLEEIAALPTPAGVKPIMWDYNNAYFSFPLLMAGGGFAFEKVDGSYDGERTGVNTDGAKAGAAAILNLIEVGAMPAGVDYGVMDAAMNKGEIAMMINGPWSWGNLEQSGINYAVAPLPSVDGQPSKPFVGVYAAAINSASPNQDLAVELLENYMLSGEGLAAWNAEGGLGALAHQELGATQAEDPRIAATLANAAAGVPMPSNPEMGKFWAAMEPALSAITSGAQPVDAALDDAANRILAK